ncbi:MAG TPA: dTMP kinase [Thermoplasmata archaeon]|nr:dTMP kinase [Thermoplasmata archaeon]
MTAPRRRGRLVFVEGIDGAGKSTLVRALRRALREQGYRVALHREPVHPALGAEAIRRGPQDPLGSALLFTADRTLAAPRVERLLARHDLLLQDRSYFSTLAYQGARLPFSVQQLLLRAQRAGSRAPDRVLWLKLGTEEALDRIGGRGGRSVLERRPSLVRAARAYARMARSTDWRTLDARLSPAELLARAVAEVHPLLGRRRRAR